MLTYLLPLFYWSFSLPLSLFLMYAEWSTFKISITVVGLLFSLHFPFPRIIIIMLNIHTHHFLISNVRRNALKVLFVDDDNNEQQRKSNIRRFPLFFLPSELFISASIYNFFLAILPPSFLAHISCCDASLNIYWVQKKRERENERGT